jgi:hypothetical protein
VLEDVTACLKAGLDYDGRRTQKARARAEIPTDSYQAQIIAACMEDDFSLQQTVAEVNLYRELHNRDGSPVVVGGKSDMQHVGLSAVYSCYNAMDKIESAVLDLKQGKDDPNSAWAKARYNWITFLMVSFRQLSDAELDVQFPDGRPAWADPTIVKQLHPNQIAWADGVHTKPITGGQGHDSP